MQRYRPTDDDVPFAVEFLANPIGYKSPGLQRVLNLMRGSGPEGKYVLLCKVPHKVWALGRLPARRGEPIEEVADITYTSLLEAECDVFSRRWRDLTGPPLEGRV